MWTPIVVPLETESVFDTGHALFHMDTGAGIACASCHPEANDDGRVWDFECIGPRRTQSLRFGIKGTEPLHWDGDMDTFGTLMNEVFVGRMSGGQPQPDQVAVMADWLDAQRPPPRSPPADPAAVERGRDIFARADVGCAACHTGPKLTNNASFDVGTGGVFQVPSLIGIADRAPFIHTGCAPTLRARLVDPACGGGDRHGVVSGLTGAEIDDLVAFLKTL
jgi:mono/diheme cytochrome c family protein